MNTFVDRLSMNAKIYKDKVAIVSDKWNLTYGQLMNVVAKRARILKKYDIKTNSIVGVISNDSVDTVINNISVAFVGGIFLPIDEKIPHERFKHICNDTKLENLIINSKFENGSEVNIKNIITFNDIDNGEEDEIEVSHDISEDDVMYILYTSGSSGLSKGVMIEKKSFAVFCNAINHVIEYDKNDVRFLCSTSLTFDISILETLVTLSYGATCVLINKNQKLSPKEVKNIILSKNVNVVQFTPTYLQFLVDYFNGDLSFLCNIKKILIGGEIFREELLKPLSVAINSEIYNCYGPTEATIWASVKRIKFGEEITLGNALKDYNIYIDVNDATNDTGEICIVSNAVAKGYLNRENLTKEKFFVNELGQKGYRTGDLGRINANREIIFLGRIDRQIKIKGFRVELDEIEKTIERCCESINRAVVVMLKNNGKESLVCYYKAAEEIERSIIIKKILEYLPSYMVPMIYVRKEKLPVMINGKIDYSKLNNEV